MIRIRKPVRQIYDTNRYEYEEHVVRDPHEVVLGGDEEDQVGETPGGRRAFRLPYSVWFEGHTPTKWELDVYDVVNESWLQTDLYRIDRVGLRIDFFIANIRDSELPVVDLNAVLLGGVPVLLGGEEVRL